ncbi:MAG: alpha/beta hydrolase [Bacteroidia bacterium]|jgi:pimeloyl-ACP methyl ester carboxylesterase|nr:alpha/beta hydrolase [uncultured Flavobacterium sp.]MBP6757328.1 alpha/beta hydrolase [Bacteroidia bacterium]
MNKIKLSVGHIAISSNKSYPDKPTIVFLHDSLGCIKLWRDFPQKLSEMTGCNLLVYDRLGYGQSENMQTHKRPINYLELEADILNELITRLELENVILFGHSDGGSIALIMASKYPTKIKAIISEAAHIFVDDLTITGINNAIKAFKTTNLRERLIKYHGSDKVDDVFKAWTETWTTKEYREWNIEHFLPNIKCPTLVIQGEKDEYGTEKQMDGIVGKVSAMTIKLFLEDLSHTPHKDNPEQILKHSATFIKTVLNE